jgi:hypothetical protein
MAILKINYDGPSKKFHALLAEFPDMNGAFLQYVGGKARKHLKRAYLSGQEIDLEKYPLDSKGKNTITSNVHKSRKFTKIYSYPVNLFERGRQLRSGRQEKGKYIITKKLKRDVEMKMSSYAQFYEKSIMTGKLKDIGL